MDKVAVNGLLTFGIAGKVDTKVSESTGKQGVYALMAAHNPEVVGSSPASATKKVPKTTRFSELFFAFGAK